MSETSQAEEIFFAALDRSPGDRAALLDQACAGDADLRARIERMLAAQSQLGRFLDLPPAGAVPDVPAAGPPEPSPEAPGAIIAGKYKLLQRIAEGGMGSVWMADQLQPVRRRVAVKLIHGDRGSSQTILARFEAERQAIALMDHPHIAKLLDAGTTDARAPESVGAGRPYFVMELIKGIPLNEFCDQHRLSIADRLHLFTQVCSAVQHAHQKGIIHRDLKPSNILVEAHDGRPVPKVIDFGLAKALSGQPLTEHTLFTAFGTVAGTPQYMAPEQAQFNAIDVDTRADIYSLGVILYELLTGTTPIERDKLKTAAFDEVLRLIREAEPPTPSRRFSSTASKPSVAANRQMEPLKLGRFLRGDLDWIVMKALAKERDRRYETANGLARDIERFLNHEPVVARPPSAAYRLRKFVRRNRAQVLAGCLLLLALLVGLAGTTWGLFNADSARRAEAEQRLIADDEKEKARQAAEQAHKLRARAEAGEEAAKEQREAMRQHLYYAQMHLAQQAWREPRGLPHMYQLLATWLPQSGQPDRRGWEWFYLNSLPHQNLRTLTPGGPVGRPCTVAWHIPSRLLAEGTPEGLIRIWDVDREQTTRVLKGPAPVVVWWGVGYLGWSPDGTKLVAGGDDGTVHVWEIGSGRKLPVLKGHKSNVWSVAFSSDGTRLASWEHEGIVKIWDIRTGKVTADVAHPRGAVCGAWSPDDRLLASGNNRGIVTISGTHAGDKARTLQGHADSVFGLAWSPDSARLATASADLTARVWDVASGKTVLGPLRHSHVVTSVVWQPDGQRLATGSIDQLVKIWDTATGHEVHALRGHLQTICTLAWGPHDSLASGGFDGSVKIWKSIRDQESSVLPGHGGRASSVAWSPDGKMLASGGDDGVVRIWHPTTGKEALALMGHDKRRVNPTFGLIRALAWSPDGAYLASAGLDGRAKVWQVPENREILDLPGGGTVWSVAWSPDGTRLAIGCGDGTIRVVEGLKRPAKVKELKAHRGAVRSLAWSPRGDRLASSCWEDQLIKIWDPIRGDELAHMQESDGSFLAVAWSSDGKRLASSGERLVLAWDAQTRHKLATMRGHTDWVEAVAWSPDGTRLASASNDGSLRIWDPRTAEEAFLLRGNAARFHAVSWHPDGAQLAAASSDGHIWLWDATRGFERDATLRGWPFIERKLASGTATTEDRLAFAHIAHVRKRFAFATRLWAEALASDPTRFDDCHTYHRYNAACAAVLVAAGQGLGEPPGDGHERSRLRKQALDGLRADLAQWTQQLERGQPAARAAVQRTMKHWQGDPDLAGIRDAAALATLPAAERAAFTTLWDDVAALLKKARAKLK
jgi:WD40 repeat protein/serine/threonine protein kinase